MLLGLGAVLKEKFDDGMLKKGIASPDLSFSLKENKHFNKDVVVVDMLDKLDKKNRERYRVILMIKCYHYFDGKK